MVSTLFLSALSQKVNMESERIRDKENSALTNTKPEPFFSNFRSDFQFT